MTEAEAKSIIQAAAKKLLAVDDQSGGTVAGAALNKAILKVGRLHGAQWNSREVEFTLTAGTAEYQIGTNILTQDGTRNLQYLWHTDTQHKPISVLPIDDFNAYARGGSTSGRPEIATIHSDNKTIEFYPIPDSGYTVWGYAQLSITQFSQVPVEYHDVLIDMAIASLNPAEAARLANEGLNEMRGDSMTRWEGNTIPISRHVGDSDRRKRSDSFNLRGD